MPFTKTLLASVALPLLALTFAAPAGAMSPRPALTVQTDGLVIKVDAVSDAKRRLRAARQALAEAQASGGDVKAARAAVQAARAELDAAMAAGGDTQGGAEEEQPKKRKQRQQAVEEQQQQEQPVIEDQQPVEEVKPKKRKQVEQTDEQPVIEDSQPVEEVQPKKRKQPVVEDVPAEDEAQQPAKKRKNQAANEDGQITIENPDGSIEVIDTQKRKRERERQQRRQEQALEEATPEVRQDVRRKKELAEDPAKTTDVIEMPVVNGAPVLDSEKDIANTGDESLRAKRKKLREERRNVAVPKNDVEAQQEFVKRNGRIRVTPILEVEGRTINRRPEYETPNGRLVGRGDDVRIIININNQIVVRDTDNSRLVRNDARIRYEALDGGRIREIVTRPDGTRIITVRNRYGEIIRRSRIDSRDREIVIFFSPDLDRGRDRLYLRDPGLELPPMRLVIPVEDYIIDTTSRPDRDYVEFLSRPPVEPVERVYTLDEVKYSARIRDKVRRIDLDTITFSTGSAEISMDQASSLRRVAKAINDILDNDPGETFLIEGHTDAVGSDESNLILSDLRAESVANVLTELYDIPPENLATQGYGERFLKIDTDEEERLNRRVTIRRVTSLVRPVASAE